MTLNRTFMVPVNLDDFTAAVMEISEESEYHSFTFGFIAGGVGACLDASKSKSWKSGYAVGSSARNAALAFRKAKSEAGKKGGRPKTTGLPQVNHSLSTGEPNHKTNNKRIPPPTPSVPEVVAAAAVVKPERKKRNQDLGLAVLDMNPAELAAWEQIESAYPAEGWNFQTRTAQPRKRNRAEAARRFLHIVRYAPIAVDGVRLTPAHMAECTLAWIHERQQEAGRGAPPCVPNIENYFSTAEGTTRHWQNALLQGSEA